MAVRVVRRRLVRAGAYAGPMSASVSTTSSSGRGRAVLLIVLVAVLAVVAAVATVVISQKTYAPTERTLSGKIQVAAGSEYVDEAAGLVVRVPEGWRAVPGGMMLESTILEPEQTLEDGSPGGLVFIGELTPEMLVDKEITNEAIAAELASGYGQTLLPSPLQSVSEDREEISSRAGDGVALSFRVVSAMQPDSFGPEGALIYSAVVGEGDSRYWLTYIGVPADGSMYSPDAEWAGEIIERFRPASG